MNIPLLFLDLTFYLECPAPSASNSNRLQNYPVLIVNWSSSVRYFLPDTSTPQSQSPLLSDFWLASRIFLFPHSSHSSKKTQSVLLASLAFPYISPSNCSQGCLPRCLTYAPSSTTKHELSTTETCSWSILFPSLLSSAKRKLRIN